METLSPTQLKVLELVAEALPDKEIGYQLKMSTATVKAHVKAIMRRLRLPRNNRTALAIHYLTSKESKS